MIFPSYREWNVQKEGVNARAAAAKNLELMDQQLTITKKFNHLPRNCSEQGRSYPSCELIYIFPIFLKTDDLERFSRELWKVSEPVRQ